MTSELAEWTVRLLLGLISKPGELVDTYVYPAVTVNCVNISLNLKLNLQFNFSLDPRNVQGDLRANVIESMVKWKGAMDFTNST